VDRGDEGGDAPCWAHELETAVTPLGATGWDQLVHQLADAVLVANRAGTITYWNDAAERLFGWSAAEATGRRLDLIIPERFRARHWDGWTAAVAAGTTRYGATLLEVPASHRDGRPLSIAFSITLLRDRTGAVSHLVAVVRDDTQRWQQRRAGRRQLADRRAEEPSDPSRWGRRARAGLARSRWGSHRFVDDEP